MDNSPIRPGLARGLARVSNSHASQISKNRPLSAQADTCIKLVYQNDELPKSCCMKDRSVGTSTGPALLALGQSCEAQGCYCAAARCYAAIPGTTQTAPVYAQAALHLARLLLARFENVPEALSALHTAVGAAWQ